MKKILKFLGAAIVTFCMIASPLNTSAAGNTNDSKSIAAYSKQITNYLRVYTGVVVPPSSYYYNQGGWSGTLKLTSWQSTGSEILAYYSGTVSCSGPCVMTKAPETK
ncbi:hypothetical protein OEV98_15405 [Caldibacillus lycopersici]|uniref:Uncharacterized protein n=1 Tax=Perspicuibacillus lycopersici TaxID=1325689 RepID=A0AAE3IX02_9BACI|nr:hypothetical protein [Perspicuibacillus lycopersici]MCU9614931.1 hypothetical protein [Perspicuibacillus lycopersici]